MPPLLSTSKSTVSNPYTYAWCKTCTASCVSPTSLVNSSGFASTLKWFSLHWRGVQSWPRRRRISFTCSCSSWPCLFETLALTSIPMATSLSSTVPMSLLQISCPPFQPMEQCKPEKCAWVSRDHLPCVPWCINASSDTQGDAHITCSFRPFPLGDKARQIQAQFAGAFDCCQAQLVSFQLWLYSLFLLDHPYHYSGVLF